jgi:hypothetical protein
MPEIETISNQIDELAHTLDHLSAGMAGLCEKPVAGGIATDIHPALAELEEVRTEAEALRRNLAALKSKGKLDPEVRDLESKLEQVLNRYYLLWQKCKDNTP